MPKEKDFPTQKTEEIKDLVKTNNAKSILKELDKIKDISIKTLLLAKKKEEDADAKDKSSLKKIKIKM